MNYYIKIENVMNNPCFLSDLILYSDKKTYKLFALDIKDCNKVWESKYKSSICLTHKNTILTNNLQLYDYNGNLLIYNTFNSELSYYLETVSRNGISLWKTIDEKRNIATFHIYDIKILSFIKENINSKLPIFFAGDNFMCCRNGCCEILLFNYISEIEIWQHDLSTLSSYTNYEGKATKGEIRKVYEYEDSVIVITQMYIFRISIASGDIIYHKKLPAGMLSLSIHQNKAYGCYGHHYLELDLNSGEVVLFCRIEQEEYKGERFFAYMNEAFYYEGLVYHGIRLSNGVHGVGIIDSSTGKRIWFHPTGVHNIETIKFHQNRLYVKDAGACLHIFEKE